MVLLANQIVSIQSEKSLKLEQAENKLKQARFKIKSDSIDLVAVKHSLRLPTRSSTVQLNKEGLKALTDVEEKRLKQQEVEGKLLHKKTNY
jgi:hypothetical protein